MPIPRTTLEQWAVLAAVVDEGSFARAAEQLNRSQSSISYALKNLQDQLPVEIMTIEGRRTVLTENGEALLRRARTLLDEMAGLERLAQSMIQEWEPEVRLAVEGAFPPDRLVQAMDRFTPHAQQSRVQFVEEVLSGTQEALLNREVDLAITLRPPIGFLGTELLNVEFVAVAHRDHELLALGRELTHQDLRGHRQFVVRDSGLKRQQNIGWLGSEQRWTVTHVQTSIQFVCQGLGFAWLPQEHIQAQLDSGLLRELPLIEGARRTEVLTLVFADRDSAGPATKALAEAIMEVCGEKRLR